MTTPASRQADLRARAEGLFPGGVNSPVRAFRSVGGTPLFFTEARGSLTTLYGELCVAWKLHEGRFELDLAVPEEGAATWVEEALAVGQEGRDPQWVAAVDPPREGQESCTVPRGANRPHLKPGHDLPAPDAPQALG